MFLLSSLNAAEGKNSSKMLRRETKAYKNVISEVVLNIIQTALLEGNAHQKFHKEDVKNRFL